MSRLRYASFSHMESNTNPMGRLQVGDRKAYEQIKSTNSNIAYPRPAHHNVEEINQISAEAALLQNERRSLFQKIQKRPPPPGLKESSEVLKSPIVLVFELRILLALIADRPSDHEDRYRIETPNRILYENNREMEVCQQKDCRAGWTRGGNLERLLFVSHSAIIR